MLGDGALDGLLGGVRMIRTGIHFEFGVLLTTEAAFRKHTPDSALEHQHGATLTNHARCFHFFTTDETGEAGINFVIFLGAAEANLIGIDDHHEVTCIDVSGEDWLVFATEQNGGFNSHSAEDFVLGVDDVPGALHVLWLGGKCFHTD